MDVGVRDTDVSSARVEVRGLLTAYGPGWRAQLIGSGYAPRTVSEQMSLMAHLSDWLEDRGLSAGALTTPVAARFLLERREQGLRPMSARSLRPMLGYLHGLQVVPDPAGRYPVTPVEQLVEAYRNYLIGERGLVPGTVRQYGDYALVFLTGPADHGHGVESLESGQVTDFLVRYCVGRSAGASKCMVVALRSLLRFLHVTGRVAMPLAEAVPSVPGWSPGPLPRGLERMQVAGLLDSCDRECARGRRDYAILLLLTRLGLRVAEVAGLRLDDVDWQTGGLIVHGKGARVEQMPLPEDVGQLEPPAVPHRSCAVVSDGADRGVGGGSPGRPASWLRPVRGAPATSHRGLRPAAGGGVPVGDRSSAAAPGRTLLLRPGGRYAIHELALLEGTEARLDLARAIKVNAQPLSPDGWQRLLEGAGFEVVDTHLAPMALLSPGRLVADEGPLGAARFVRNVMRDREARQRMLGMRAVFRRRRRMLRGIAIVARRTGEVSETTDPTTLDQRSTP